MDRYDGIVVGSGPTGLAATALLGKRGWKVAAFEKHLERYALPRAGHIDHEILRIAQGVEAHQPIIDDQSDYDVYEWFSADGELMMSFPFAESVSGFRSDYMMFQPVLDDALYEAIARTEGGTIESGRMVTDLEQDGDGVTVDLAHMTRDADGHTVPDGETSTAWAPWVLVADGAGSTIRDEILKVPREDFGFNENWLTIDVRIKRKLPSGINGQWCDPRRPTYVGGLGRRYHRFECMMLPGETEEQMLDPEMAWRVMGNYGVTRDHVEIFRQIVYSFEARVAERWRDGRVFLLGDAAHTMPPFMGQGLCAGVRDSANLAWKLDLVRSGFAGEALLDTYQLERQPHVQRWIDLSIMVGEISCTLDGEKAAARDEAILTGTAPPLPGLPVLSGGVLREVDGQPSAPVGDIFIQARVARGDRQGLLHDVVGHGFLLVGVDGALRPSLGSDALDLLARIGCGIWSVDGEESDLRDLEGKIRAWFEANGIVAALVRPDYNVAAAATSYDELPELVGWLGEALGPAQVAPGFAA